MMHYTVHLPFVPYKGEHVLVGNIVIVCCLFRHTDSLLKRERWRRYGLQCAGGWMKLLMLPNVVMFVAVKIVVKKICCKLKYENCGQTWTVLLNEELSRVS